LEAEVEEGLGTLTQVMVEQVEQQQEAVAEEAQVILIMEALTVEQVVMVAQVFAVFIHGDTNEQ
jgi:hypothetical protein